MSIYIEMNLFFDNDFDVYKIEKLLNIEPSDCKRRNETRPSPFDKSKHLDGYWSLMTDTFEELDIKPAMDDLLKKLEGKLEIIKEICKKITERFILRSFQFLKKITCQQFILKKDF